MVRRRGAVGFGMVFALVLSAGLFGQQLDKKIDEALKREAQALSKLADGALAAQGGQNEFDVTWAGQDFLKGPEGKEFVPFTVTLDPTKVPGGNLALYWRVAAAGAATGSDKESRQQPAGRSHLGGRHLRRRRDCAEPAAAQPLVRSPGRDLRRVRRRERAAGGEAQKRPGAKNSRAETDGERPGLLEQRIDDELGHRRRPNRSACQRRSRRRSSPSGHMRRWASWRSFRCPAPSSRRNRSCRSSS